MQSFGMELIGRFASTDATVREQTSPWRRFKQLFAFAAKRRSASQALPGHEGSAWCDSSERDLTSDIMHCRRSWIF